MLLYLGIGYRLLGDDDRALELYEGARRSQHSLFPDTFGAWVWIEEGLLLLDVDDYAQARALFERALSMIDANDRSERAWFLIPLGHALIGLGQLTEAQEAYRESLSLFRDLGEFHISIVPLSGLAAVALAAGHSTEALAYAEEVLSYLGAHPALDAHMGELFRMYLTCYRVLRANQDPRAGELLSQAYRVLRESADKIEDPDLRRSFLENVAVNREIVREWERLQAGASTDAPRPEP